MSFAEAEPPLPYHQQILAKLKPYFPTDPNRLTSPVFLLNQSKSIVTVGGQFEHTDSCTVGLVGGEVLIDAGSIENLPFLVANVVQHELLSTEIDPRLSPKETYRKLLTSALRKIKKIALTHIHPDHVSALPVLQRMIQKVGGNAQVLAPKGSVDEMNSPEWHHVGELFYPGKHFEYFQIHETATSPFSVGNAVITPVEAPGHEINHVGYIVEVDDKTLLFAGDAVGGCYSPDITSNLAQYRQTYQLITDLAPDAIVEGHGYPDGTLSFDQFLSRAANLAYTQQELEPGGFAGTLKAQL